MLTDTLDPIPLDATWIQPALLLSREAGWNQNAADWAVFFTHGTVLGFTIHDRLVATAAALPYGDDFGWISMVLVAPEWRRQGLAHRLVTACMSIMYDNGRGALLDAAPAAVGIYAALGFLPLCTMERWEGDSVGGAVASADLTLDRFAFGANLALDRFAFGSDRGFLFEDFLSRTGSRVLQSPHGFAILRHGSAAFHLGPIVAEPGEASALVVEAIGAVSGRLLVDVLDAGSGIIPQLTAFGFRQRRCFTRMALGITALPGNPAWLLAAAGPEFG